ncbi:glycosyltransferase family 2 protein [Paraburkholderia aspalathi]|nr:glycosyltransferase family 2 protein [Paraburkholderia aspalathi]
MVVVVVLNWNRGEDTVCCLESLYRQSYTNYSVVVVDNASTDDSRARIWQWASNQPSLSESRFQTTKSSLRDGVLFSINRGDFIMVNAESNGGYAAGNNIGINLGVSSSAKYIWLLNNDTELHRDALAELVAAADDDDRIGMCGSLLIDYREREIIQAIGGVKFNVFRASGRQIGNGSHLSDGCEEITRPTYVAGASLLARTEMVREIGLLEERYFLYYEEIDWARRASQWEIGVASKSIVYHKEGGTIGTRTSDGRSELSQYYLARNILLFYFRFHRAFYVLAVLKVVKEIFAELIKGSGLARVTLRALLDGLNQKTGAAEIEIINRQ